MKMESLARNIFKLLFHSLHKCILFVTFIVFQILTDEKESIFSMVFQRDTLIANLREQINALKMTVQKQQVINEKLKLTKKKLFDLQNQNIKLRNDYKLAQKFVQQEIGEHMSLQQLTDPKSTWRGRAQQILSLQQRVNELKAVMGEQPKVENGRNL